MERVAGGTEVAFFIASVVLSAATAAGAGVTLLNAEKIGW
jgi:hypothetical protein